MVTQVLPTTKGPLTRTEYEYNGSTVVEYVLNGEVIHRSAAVGLVGLQATGITDQLNAPTGAGETQA